MINQITQTFHNLCSTSKKNRLLTPAESKTEGWIQGSLILTGEQLLGSRRVSSLWASAIANWLPRGRAACATRSRLIASVALIKRRTSSQPGPGPPRDTRLMWLRESEEEKMDQGRKGGENMSVSTSWKRLEGERCKNWKVEEHIANTSVLSNAELIYSSYKWFSLELSLTAIKPLQNMHVISLCLTSMVTSSCSHPVQNSHWITYCKMRRNWWSILNLWALNYGEIERHLGRIHKLDAAVPPRALSNSST